MAKFTFKKEKLGTWDIKKEFTIKLNGKPVGSISEQKDGRFAIKFMVMKTDSLTDGNPNCPWLWITLKVRLDSSELAKQYVLDYQSVIMKKYTLYQGDGK